MSDWFLMLSGIRTRDLKMTSCRANHRVLAEGLKLENTELYCLLICWASGLSGSKKSPLINEHKSKYCFSELLSPTDHPFYKINQSLKLYFCCNKIMLIIVLELIYLNLDSVTHFLGTRLIKIRQNHLQEHV